MNMPPRFAQYCGHVAAPGRAPGRSPAARLAALTCFVLLAALPAAGHSYEYPFADPFLATVAGTPEPVAADLPKVRLRNRALPKDSARHIPEVLSYGRKIEYSTAWQKGPAPLVFVIAGTGSYHNSATNSALLRGYYSAGFHVVGISSPTHPKFIISASSTAVPGNMAIDAADLHKVMARIWAQHQAKLSVQGFYLAGYSLGAMHAAFVTRHDDANPLFNFRRVLLINSPVSLYSSISKLDRMLDSVPGGVDNFDRYFNGIVERIGGIYTRNTNVEFSQELVFAAFKDQPPTRSELAAVIGAAFRLAAMNMIFTADVMTDFGFIKPSAQQLPSNADLDPYLQVALRVGLTDYFHEFFWPYYEHRYPGQTRAEFAEAQSLRAIRGLLAKPRFHAVHNADDIILSGQEITFFERTFGSRARIYPRGGHLGNITQRETMGHIVDVLASDARTNAGARP